MRVEVVAAMRHVFRLERAPRRNHFEICGMMHCRFAHLLSMVSCDFRASFHDRIAREFPYNGS